MKRTAIRGILTGAATVLLTAWATAAAAQVGTIRGKVVDTNGKPVDQAEVVLDYIGDYNRQLKTITDKNGEFIRAGTPTGKWKISVKKFDMVGENAGVQVTLGETLRVPEIVIGKPGAGGGGAAKPMAVSEEEAERLKKRAAMLDKLSAEANTSLEAGNYDDAIAKVQAIMKEIPTCAPCHAKIGDINVKKGDLDAAEKAYLAAIAADEKLPGPYGALATLYNQQKKFDEAVKMSTKANDLIGAGGGAGDANGVFNQGIILWNSSKIPEAAVQFEKATKLDPKLAEAHYWLGMALVNQGKLPEAKAPFTEYLKLAPTGQYADTAKAILATIK
jgi:tetratricopeptide (TPR) repeat protein